MMCIKKFLKLKQFGLLSVLVVLLSGCAQTYQFRVDGLSHPDGHPPERKYVFRSMSPALNPESLRFTEAARYLERALAEKGYVRVLKEEDADLFVDFALGVSEPMTATERRSEPVYVQTYGYSRLVRVPVRGGDGKVTGYSVASVYVPPRTELAGYTDYDRQVTVYEKMLEISVIERTEDGKEGREWWTLLVGTRDQSTDVRSYLPYIIRVATPYMGQTTDGELIVRMKEGDPATAEVVEVKRGR